MPSGAYAAAVVAAGVVPWADLPYRSPVDPAPAAHPAGTPPWCSTADLVLGPGGGGDAAATQRWFSWQLLARPGHRCSLQGSPVIHETSADGSWTQTSVTVDDFAVSAGGVLDAEHPGTLDFRWGLGSDGLEADLPLGPRHLTIDLPHRGGRLSGTDASEGWADNQAPTPPRHLGRIVAEPLYTSGAKVYAGPYAAAFTAELRLDRRAIKAGSTLSYEVWVSGRPLASPCFGFRESLVSWRTGKVVASEVHQLSCASVPSLPPYGRLFAMELRVPASVPSGGDYQLDWESDVGSDYAAGPVSLPVTVSNAYS